MKSRNVEISLLIIGWFPYNPALQKNGIRLYKSTGSAIRVHLNARPVKQIHSA